MKNKRKLKESNYQVQEDLCPIIYKRLKEVRAIEGVEKCWTIDGKVKYKLKDDDKIHMIHSEFDLNTLKADFGMIDYANIPKSVNLPYFYHNVWLKTYMKLAYETKVIIKLIFVDTFISKISFMLFFKNSAQTLSKI